MDQATPSEVLQPESAFSYQCKHCFQCCRTRQVSLNPYDIDRLAEHESISTGQFIDLYMQLTEQGAFLKHVLEGDCTFLGEHGCLAYENRPLACRTYPLLRQTDLNKQVSLLKLEQRTGSTGIYQTDGNVETYLKQNQCESASSAADQYAQLFVRLFRRIEQHDTCSTNTETLLSDTVLFQSILLDMDLMIRCHRPGVELPRDANQKMYRHIDAINAWLAGELKTFVLLDAFGSRRNKPSHPDLTDCGNAHAEIEGCIWPKAPSRLNAWTIALDYQFRHAVKPTPQEHESLLLQQLEALLKHHSEFSPFYRSLWPRNKSPGLTLHRFKDTPLLRREQLLEAGALLFSTRLPSSHGMVMEQAAPKPGAADLKLKISELTLAFQKAGYAGLLPENRLLQRGRSTIVLPANTVRSSLPGNGLHWFSGPGNRTVSMLDPETLSLTELVDSLLIERPAEILTNGNTWQFLNDFLNRNKIQTAWLEQVFITQSEETGFDLDYDAPSYTTPLIELFTMSEVGIVAARKAQEEAYRVPMGHIHVEILNQENDPCRDGESGRIVVTDLHNFATPVIRYVTGVTGVPVQTSAAPGSATGCRCFVLNERPPYA